jgi:hypothetical protein
MNKPATDVVPKGTKIEPIKPRVPKQKQQPVDTNMPSPGRIAQSTDAMNQY